jgi:hypothetical protein
MSTHLLTATEPAPTPAALPGVDVRRASVQALPAMGRRRRLKGEAAFLRVSRTYLLHGPVLERAPTVHGAGHEVRALNGLHVSVGVPRTPAAA